MHLLVSSTLLTPGQPPLLPWSLPALASAADVGGWVLPAMVIGSQQPELDAQVSCAPLLWGLVAQEFSFNIKKEAALADAEDKPVSNENGIIAHQNNSQNQKSCPDIWGEGSQPRTELGKGQNGKEPVAHLRTTLLLWAFACHALEALEE